MCKVGKVSILLCSEIAELTNFFKGLLTSLISSSQIAFVYIPTIKEGVASLILCFKLFHL